MVFVVGFAAGIFLAFGYVLQQRVAAHASRSSLLSYRLLWEVMRRPVWWAGIACMVVGQVLGGLALDLGSVALVEPLLSSSLLFAFLIAAVLSDQRVRWFEIAGALLVSAALGVFIAVGNPRPASAPRPSVAVVVLAVVSVAVVVGIVVSIGKRRALVVESILLALGAGLLYGLQDVGTRAALVVANHDGIARIFANAWVYIVIAAAVVGLLLSQSAFRAARLDYSLPPIAVAEPVTGIALGVTVLGDVISFSAGGLAVESACLAAMIAGVILIGRSSTLATCGPAHARAHLLHQPRRTLAPVPARVSASESRRPLSVRSIVRAITSPLRARGVAGRA
ncbi:MAG: DMT family transporter [Actinobacteria bacterium]|nr:DMT family transporter [Actinomycetota bacterium]